MTGTKIEFSIPPEKVAEYVEYYCYLFPNTEVDAEGEPLFTDGQWVREHTIRTFRGRVIRGRNRKAQDEISSYNADDVE